MRPDQQSSPFCKVEIGPFRCARSPLMRGTCHIHIGLHKTGSTSIQKMLAAEKARLSACGFYVPGTGLNESGVAHHLLAKGLGRESSGETSLLRTLAEELENA